MLNHSDTAGVNGKMI